MPEEVIDFEFKIDPLTEAQLLAKLAALPRRVYGKVIGQALGKSVRLMVTAARRHLRRQERNPTSGLLGKSIGTRIVKYPARGVVYAAIGPRSGFKGPVRETDPRSRGTGTRIENPQMIGHLVEKGTRPHSISRGARLGRIGARAGTSAARGVAQGPISHPGARPRPFMRPAFDETAEPIIRKYREKVLVGIDKETAKLAGAG